MVPPTVTVRVEVIVPSAGGVGELGENDVVTPDGAPVTVRVMAELKVLREVRVMVEVSDFPCVMVRVDGLADAEKLGGEPRTVQLEKWVMLAETVPVEVFNVVVTLTHVPLSARKATLRLLGVRPSWPSLVRS